MYTGTRTVVQLTGQVKLEPLTFIMKLKAQKLYSNYFCQIYSLNACSFCCALLLTVGIVCLHKNCKEVGGVWWVALICEGTLTNTKLSLFPFISRLNHEN